MSDSVLFTPKTLGRLTVPNRFMRSATWEALADKEGRASDTLIKMMENLATGNVGLIIPGAVYVTKKGQGLHDQSGLCTTEHARIWHRGVANVHKLGSKLVFQLIHGGTASDPNLNGGFPAAGPTAFTKDQHELTNSEIEDIIQNFADSAELAHLSEADGVQLHCAHGYLLSEFLSPALNRRTDKWGGSDENRLRIVQEIISTIKNRVPENFSISIKMNGNDYIDGGVTPQLAAKYVKSLVKDIDFFEISGGTAPKYVIRSNLNERALKIGVPKEKQEGLIKTIKEILGDVKFSELYHTEEIKTIRAAVPGANLALVGGNRTFKKMEAAVKDGIADMISLSRPLLNDPYLVHRFKVKTLDKALCINCGACVLNNENGVFCHIKNK